MCKLLFEIKNADFTRTLKSLPEFCCQKLGKYRTAIIILQHRHSTLYKVKKQHTCNKLGGFLHIIEQLFKHVADLLFGHHEVLQRGEISPSRV